MCIRDRAKWFRKAVGEGAYHLHELVKSALDPKNLLNPGKMVDDVYEVAKAAELVSDATRRILQTGSIERPVISSCLLYTSAATS